MPNLYIVDSTNTTRLTRRLFVVDSTNTTRLVKKVWIIDSGGTPRLAFVAVQIIPTTVVATAVYPAAATATITFNTDGTETIQSNQIPVPQTLGTWIVPPTSGFQIRALLQSGNAPNAPGATNTLNAWLPAIVPLSWGLTARGTDILSTLLLQISSNSSTVIASGTVTLEASGLA